MLPTRALFLDRDGAINRPVIRAGRPHPPASLTDFEALPGVVEAVQRFKDAGVAVIIVTHQPDVATGWQRREVVEAMHAHLRDLLPLDDATVCYHTDTNDCACRNLIPGMPLATVVERCPTLADSLMVGDRWWDIEATRAAGCRTVLVRNPYSERSAEQPDWIVDSLLEAITLLDRTWPPAGDAG